MAKLGNTYVRGLIDGGATTSTISSFVADIVEKDVQAKVVQESMSFDTPGNNSTSANRKINIPLSFVKPTDSRLHLHHSSSPCFSFMVLPSARPSEVIFGRDAMTYFGMTISWGPSFRHGLVHQCAPECKCEVGCNGTCVQRKPEHVCENILTRHYEINPQVLSNIQRQLGVQCTVDAFCNAQNRKFGKFISEKWEPGCLTNNFFTISPSRFRYETLWVNPPFEDLEEIADWLVLNPMKSVVLVPNWESRPWFSSLKTMANKSCKVSAQYGLFLDKEKRHMPMTEYDFTAFYITPQSIAHSTHTAGSTLSTLKNRHTGEIIQPLINLNSESSIPESFQPFSSSSLPPPVSSVESTIDRTDINMLSNPAICVMCMEQSVGDKVEYVFTVKQQPTGDQYNSEISASEIMENIREYAKKNPDVHTDIIELLMKYGNIFEKAYFDENKAAAHGAKHTITLLPNAKPYRGRPYRLSPVELRALRKILDKYLERNWIRPSQSEWAAPAYLRPKKRIDEEGNPEFRLIVDYRKLNERSKRQAYPLNRIDEILNKVHGKKIFSTMDLETGYSQLAMDPEASELAAFTTPFGLFAPAVLPQGLHSAPPTFQEVMNNILADPVLGGYCDVYLDDILCASNTVQEHVCQLEKIFKCIEKANLKLRLSKCVFGKKQVLHLGHIVSESRISPNPDKVQAIKEYSVPKDTKELHRFLGLTGWYQQFVPNYARIAIPLTNMLKGHMKSNKKILSEEEAKHSKGSKLVVWTKECQSAFENLRIALMTEPVLATPDRDAPYDVWTDASNHAISAVLQQGGHPVCYYSKKLNETERGYSTYEQESLAVYVVCKKYRHLLDNGQPVRIYTDNSAVTTLFSQQWTSKRQARIWQRLSGLDLKLVHIPGTKNTAADALTRQNKYINANEVEMEAEKIVNTPMLKDDEAREDWRRAYLADATYRNYWLSRSEGQHTLYVPKNIHCSGGLLRCNGRVLVPLVKRQSLLEAAHDLCGHNGTLKVLESLRNFTWPMMKEEIQDYIRTCPDCQRDKSKNHKQWGSPFPLAPTVKPFQRLHVDLVYLPRVGSYDAIFTVIDSFSKFGFAEPCNREVTAERLADMFALKVLSVIGIPENLVIVSDRGPQFEREFWREFVGCFGAKHKMTSVYYPASNGAVERWHQDIGKQLRIACHTSGKSWLRCLGQVVHVHNTTYHRSIGTTPHHVVFGERPSNAVTAWEGKQGMVHADVADRVKEIRKIVNKVASRLRKTANEMSESLDKKRSDKTPNYSEGDLVLLRTKEWFPVEDEKLQPRYLGPFYIKEVRGNQAVLDLPKECRFKPFVNFERLELWKHSDKYVRAAPIVTNLSKEHTRLQGSTDSGSVLIGGNFVDFPVRGKQLGAILDSRLKTVQRKRKRQYQIQLRDNEDMLLPPQWVYLKSLVSSDLNRVVHETLGHYLVLNPGCLPTLKELQSENVSWLKEWLINKRNEATTAALSWLTFTNTCSSLCAAVIRDHEECMVERTNCSLCYPSIL